MKLFSTILLVLISSILHAQHFNLVKEINTSANGSAFGSSIMARVGSTIYFIANDDNNGNELWKTDGTEQGTVMVKDITVGSGSTAFSLLVAGNDILFFVANDGVNGSELWCSDGTETGTFMLKDINPGSASSAINRALFHNGLLFFGADDGSLGQELWKSDGTTAGTVMIKDINPGPTASSPAPFSNASYTFVAMGNEVFFAALDPAAGRELYKTDGTEAGTVLVKDIWPGATSGIGTTTHKAAVHDGRLYFAATNGVNGIELWSTDGTETGTSMVKDLVFGSGSSQPNNLISFNNALYFSASPVNNGTPNLYKTDGTEGGTVLVKDLVSDGITITLNIGNSTAINDFTIAANKLFFRANSSLSGLELFLSDGTTAGTGLLKDISQGIQSSSPTGLIEMNGKLYFTAFDPAPQRNILFSSDGTEAGTVHVIDGELADVLGVTSVPFISTGAKLFFWGSTQDGNELWSTDGSSAGTTIVKNINTTITGTPNLINQPFSTMEMNGYRFFAAGSPDHSMELWKSNGTTAGTIMVKDIWPGKGPSSPQNFFMHGGYIYFSANDGVHGNELWRTDGTEGGTVMLKDINPGNNGSNPARFTVSNNYIYFSAFTTATGNELWRTDGTEAGTTLVLDLVSGPATGFTALEGITLNDEAYFIAGIGAGNSLGIASGTKLIKVNGATNSLSELSSTIATAQDITLSGNTLYVAGRNVTNQTLLWKSVNGGAVEQVKLLSNTAVTIIQLTDCAGKLYFSASDGIAGTEPWVSDGTEAGTFMLKDINPGTGNSNPFQYVLSGGKVFFTATSFTGTGVNNYEIYITDGTVAGTYLLKDIQPGAPGSFPTGIISYPANKVLFTANDGVNGIELWQSDGTNTGTTLLQDFNSGGDGFINSSSFINFASSGLTRLGDGLLFFARNAVNGFQLYGGSMAATYYVNDNSQTGDVFTTAVGNDANPGTSSEPFATLAHAVSQAKNGDTIYVDAGTHPVASILDITKSLTILGPNYAVSPNDNTDKYVLNSSRNAEAILTGSFLRLNTDNITIKGFKFSPTAAAINTGAGTNCSNITIEKNHFEMVTSITAIQLSGASFAPILSTGFTITDNRFERMDLGTGRALFIGGSKNVLIDNNVFFESTATPNKSNGIGTADNRIIEDIMITNNHLKKLNVGMLPFILKNALIQHNVFDSCSSGINYTPGNAPGPVGSSNVTIDSNSFTNIRTGRSILVRGGTNGGINNFTVSNNIINQAVDGISGVLATIQLEYVYTSSFDNTIVSNNIINISGDYNNVASPRTNPGIMLQGNHTQTTVTGNELNFTAINYSFNTLLNLLPPLPTGIFIRTDATTPELALPSSAAISIANNKVNGFKYSVAFYDPTIIGSTVGEFGHLTSGAIVNINNNSFTSDSMSIDNGTISQSVNATCNWYGSASEHEINPRISAATVQHIPWLTDGTDSDPAPGFQPVANTCNGYPGKLYVNDNSTMGDVFTTAVGNNTNPGTAAAPFATLQYAISIAKNGDTIYVDAGTYIENVIINKQLVIRGVKYGQAPGSSLDRVGETIFHPAVNNTILSGPIFKPTANNITIDGFLLDGDNPNLGGGSLVNGIDCNAGAAIFNDAAVLNNLTVINNISKNTAFYGIGQNKNASAPAVSGALFKNNRVHNVGSRGIVLNFNAYGSIEDNYITGVNTSGIWIANSSAPNPSGLPLKVMNNIVSAGTLGIQVSAVHSSAPSVEVLNNEVTITGNGYGLSVIGNSSGVLYSYNKVTGGLAGIMINSSVANNLVSFTNNSFTGYTTKIMETFSSTISFNATCNWYGTAALQDFLNMVNTNLTTLFPYLTDGTDQSTDVGFQPSPVACDGYPPVIVLDNYSNVTCNGAANGSIHITASYGKAPFVFTWTKDGDPGFVSNAEDPTGLTPGTYRLSLIDANGTNIYVTSTEAEAQEIIEVTITEPAILNVAMSGTTASCNGSVTATVSGGTEPYSYLWNNGSTASSISNVPSGTYTVVITDANGCIANGTFTITGNSPINPSTSLVHVSCFGGSDGSITVTGTNSGTVPFTYNLNGSAFQESNVFSNLTAGLYVVGIKDANGCSDFVNRTITEPSLLSVVLDSVRTSCGGVSNGRIYITASGGSGGKSYAWTGPNGYTSTAQDPNNLAAGIYNVIVTDNKGCTAELEVNLPEWPPIIITETVTHVTCNGEFTGAIDITVSGGTGSFTYSWRRGTTAIATTEDISGQRNGNYTVTVTDITSGCSSQKTITINQPASLSVSATRTNATGCNSLGTITATGAGGTPPYAFSLDDISYQASGTFTGLYAGAYTVYLKDANGCIATRVMNITDNGRDEYEGNNSKNQSKTIAIGSAIAGRIAISTDIADWFNFSIPSGGAGNYTVTLTHPSASFVIDLFPSGNNAPALTPVNVTATSKEYSLAENSTYYIRVTGGLSYVCYNLSVTNGVQARIAQPLYTQQANPKLDAIVVKNLSAMAYPNPHNGQFTLQISSPESGMSIIQLFDASGRLITTRNKMLLKGNANIESFSNIGEAILFYRISIGKQAVAGKIIGQY